MRRYWNAIKDWWQRQPGRERVAMGLEAAIFIATLSYVLVALLQLGSMKDTLSGQTRMIDENRDLIVASQKQAQAAITSAKTAEDAVAVARAQLELSQRPWIRITHRIVEPLTFDVPAWKGKVASITIENTLENVGSSVAEDVFYWEDVIPMDSPFSIKSAQARQKQWCDANRHPHPTNVPGYVLFPHDPMVQRMTVGPPMETVMKATQNAPKGLEGHVALVMVGCVSYRVPFEHADASRHETWFTYTLANPGQSVPNPVGGQPWIEPKGAHPELQLLKDPGTSYAD